nr:MAG TPA: YopX protein [Bacteriophage sp.]
MKDRYLYKAKRADNGEWVVWNALTGIPHDISITQDTICQCTGLKDKNGKLIWENDFLKYELGGVRIDSVKISSPIFSQTMRLNLQNYEIIGNIFDNPELLESEE